MTKMTRWMTALASVALASSTAAPAAAESLDFDIVTNGVVNGSLTVDLRPKGRVHMENRYQQQDKVRTFTADVTVGADGLPTAMRRVGEAFAFQPIDEEFSTSEGRATWRNRVEQDSAAADGRYYIPYGLTYGGGLSRDGAAYELGLLASALLRAGDGGLALLPVGRATAAVVLEHTVTLRERSARLRLVAITGTSLDPLYVWLDDRDRLFAGDGVIRREWREIEPALIKLAAEADDAAVERAVNSVGLTKSSEAILIRDVAVFDARRGRLLPNRSVLVRDGRIARIDRASRRVPAEVRVIEGRGATLLPGLWDMHVHLRPRDLLRNLATGVTTVRDMGNFTTAMNRLKARVTAGRVPGPTIVKAGFMDAAGPAATYNGTLVADQAEALAAVDAYAAAGYAQIKLYNGIKLDWVPAIARRAHQRGLRLSGHVPFGATIQQAITGGYDEVQHLIYPILGIAGRPAATPLTFNTARAALAIDPNGKETAAFAALLRKEDVALDMTLAVYEPLFLAEVGKVPAPIEAIAAALPEAARRQTKGGALPTPPDMTTAQFRATFATAQSLMRRFHALGVTLIAGTDTISLGGLTLPRELELMVAAGLKPADVLQIATLGAARTMRRDDRSGSIEAGKDADLILVEGNPVADISAVRRIRSVFKAGVEYDPQTLLTVAKAVAR